MKVLVDTNVILRFTQNANPSHALARSALTQLSKFGHELCLVPQSIYEYWVVATRPVAVNGFGMLVADADQQVQELLQHFVSARRTAFYSSAQRSRSSFLRSAMVQRC